MIIMANELFLSIKHIGWDAISLTKKGYRGAIKAYNSKMGKVPVFFYLDECFVIEDSQGLFRVEDLKDFFFKHKEVDLEATGCIEGLSLVGFIEDGKTEYMTDTLKRLGIDNKDIKADIDMRLRAVNRLGELEDVDMGF